jgi:hypothetical protein
MSVIDLMCFAYLKGIIRRIISIRGQFLCQKPYPFQLQRSSLDFLALSSPYGSIEARALLALESTEGRFKTSQIINDAMPN